MILVTCYATQLATFWVVHLSSRYCFDVFFLSRFEYCRRILEEYTISLSLKKSRSVCLFRLFARIFQNARDVGFMTLSLFEKRCLKTTLNGPIVRLINVRGFSKHLMSKQSSLQIQIKSEIKITSVCKKRTTS